MKGYVRNIIKNSAVDGPGNRYVVFFQGCPMRCLYCHNPETIDFYNEKEHGDISIYTPEELLKKIRPYRDYISGVTFSGGECTAQFEFLLECAVRLRTEGIHVLLDTNGTLPLEKLRRLEPEVDGFMLDIKAWDEKKHRDLAGIGNQRVIETLDFLLERQKIAELRTVYIKDVVDIQRIFEALVARGATEVPYKLIAFRKHGIASEGQWLEVPGQSEMKALKERAESMGFTQIRVI